MVYSKTNILHTTTSKQITSFSRSVVYILLLVATSVALALVPLFVHAAPGDGVYPSTSLNVNSGQTYEIPSYKLFITERNSSTPSNKAQMITFVLDEKLPSFPTGATGASSLQIRLNNESCNKVSGSTTVSPVTVATYTQVTTAPSITYMSLPYNQSDYTNYPLYQFGYRFDPYATYWGDCHAPVSYDFTPPETPPSEGMTPEQMQEWNLQIIGTIIALAIVGYAVSLFRYKGSI